VAYRGVRIAAVLTLVVCASCSGRDRGGHREPEARRGPREDAIGPAPTGEHEIVAPGLRLPAGVEPRAYRLALEIDPATDVFHGQVELDLELAEPRDHVWVHAVQLELGPVEIDVRGARRPGMIAPVTGDEMVAIDLGGTVAAGPVTIRIKYDGRYHDDDEVGLFHRDDAGHRYVYSQLEAVQARKVVPCLDEPRFKVPWLVTVVVPPGLTAVGNAPVATVDDHGADGRVFHFAPTEPLPSYLLAFAVGPFAVLDLGTVGARATPLRVIAPAGTKPAAAAWVRAATPRVIDRLEAYFARPLPYAKLDLVAVPDFPGAMENAGLVVFDRDLLLVGPGVEARTGFIELAAHELAHQWFGNLVTLAWWDDLWLNESFATWMADKVAAELAPARDDAVAVHDEIETAMTADTSPAAAALRREIRTNAEIEDSFDAIAYEKGAAVLAMFEAWVGPDPMRTAMRAYIERHAGGVSDSTGFLDEIERVSDAGVRGAFASYVDQAGVPLVSLERRCDGGTTRIAVTQERLVPVGTATPVTAWRVPVCVRFPTATGKPAQGCVMLDGTAAEIALPGQACPAWLIGNAGDRGYYRAHVDGDLMPPIAALTPRERLGLVGGLEALIDAGRADPGSITTLVPALIASGEARDERAALELLRASATLVAPARRDAWRRWVRRLVAPVLVRTRADARAPAEGARARRWTDRITFAAFELDDARVIGEARARAERWLDAKLALTGDELGLVLAAAAHGADRAFADRLLAKAATMSAGAERSAVVAALGGIGDVEAARAALAAVIDADIADATDIATVLEELARGAATRALVVELYANPAHLARMIAALGKPGAADTLIAPFGAGCDPDARATAVATLTPIAKDLDGGDRALADALREIDRCIARRAALGARLDLELGP